MGRQRYTSSVTRVRVDKKRRMGNVDVDVLIVAGACCRSSERVDIAGVNVMAV